MRQQTRALKEPAEKVVQDIRRSTAQALFGRGEFGSFWKVCRGEDSIAEPSGGHGVPSWR